MTTVEIAIGLLIVFAMISGILFVLFGQITVRKLRKNPATRDYLGVEFASGWDILNVARAFAIPRSWNRKAESSQLSGFYAKSEILREHTNRFDQILGAIFYWFYVFTGSTIIIVILYESLIGFN